MAGRAWVAGPTQSAPSRTKNIEQQFTFPTETFSVIETPMLSWADYFKYRPMTDGPWGAAFTWEELSTGCRNLLNKYCDSELSLFELDESALLKQCPVSIAQLQHVIQSMT